MDMNSFFYELVWKLIIFKLSYNKIYHLFLKIIEDLGTKDTLFIFFMG